MPLTPHKTYDEYKKEHLGAGRSSSTLVSQAQWSGGSSSGSSGSSGEAGSGQDSFEVSGAESLGSNDSTFEVSGRMREVGQTGAGQAAISGSILSSLQTNEDDVILYDQATGKLYATNDWRDVKWNWDALVDRNTGQRQRVIGATGTDSGLSLSTGGGMKPGGIDLILGYGETAPEPGTEAFQDWVRKKYREGMLGQAMSHQYDPETGSTGTGYGGYGYVTFSDWVEMGRPDKIGNDTIVGLSDEDRSRLDTMSDEEVASLGGGFVVQDQENRSHGIESALNSVGSLWGDRNFGHEAMRIAGQLSAIPVFGSVASLFTDPILAYEAARDSGAGTSGALKEAGKAEIGAGFDLVIEAAQLAIVIGSLALAPFSGGASLVVTGAVVGAMAGAAGSAAKQGVHTTIYGGYDEGALWNAMGEGAATGAVSGALQGLGYAAGMDGASETVVNLDKAVNGLAGKAVLGTAEQYGLAAAKYGGETEKLAMKNLTENLWLTAAANAAYAGSKVAGGGKWNEALFSGSADEYALARNQGEQAASPLGSFGAAFRETAAKNSLVSWALGRGSKTREYMQAYKKYYATKDAEFRAQGLKGKELAAARKADPILAAGGSVNRPAASVLGDLDAIGGFFGDRASAAEKELARRIELVAGVPSGASQFGQGYDKLTAEQRRNLAGVSYHLTFPERGW